MITLGYMAWRIGEILAIHEQLDWIFNAGFEGVAFHASAGVPGEWQGIDPATCRGASRVRLRRAVERFRRVEIHAPFAAVLRSPTLAQAQNALTPALELAADVGAAVVTAHAELPTAEAGADVRAWDDVLGRLDRAAQRYGTAIGLEISSGFEWLARCRFATLGVTLDVGHVVAYQGGQTLRELGGLGVLVQSLGRALVQAHVHDFDGRVDHIEPGTGSVDFDALFAALRAIGFTGGMSLELNPDRVTPAGIRRSRAFVQARLDEASG